jgi:probable F420-dependent oxidoreductase
MTERLRFLTTVYILPARTPVHVAKQVGTAAVLSGNRVDLGVGMGWMEEEFDAMALPFAKRGKRADGMLEVMRKLWTGEVVEHHGTHFDFDAVMFEPKPLQTAIPVSVGGDAPPALRRAALLGDGWLPMSTPLDRVPAALETIGKLRAEAGRNGPWTTTFMGQVSSPADVTRAADAGVDRLVVSPWRRSAEAADGMRAFASTFLSQHEEDTR